MNIEMAHARAYIADGRWGKVEDPIEALSELAAEVIVMKDYFRSQIEALRYQSPTGEQLRAEVALYERALDRCVRILETMAKLGISERRTAIAEAQAITLMAVISNVLDRLELTEDQRAIAGAVVPEELRAIEAAEAPEPAAD